MDFFSFIVSGAILGLTAGISPGPVLTLVISETLRYGSKEGIKVALSPLITDLPIILISLFILTGLGSSRIVLGILSLTGGLFIIYLGFECLKPGRIMTDLENPAPKSLKKGIVTNLLNPNPYLFWITVGAPLVFKAWQVSLWAVTIFFFSFYLMLVGSKVIIAILSERSKSFLNNKGYVWVMRILGIALIIFAIMFLAEGLKALIVEE
jgi:threonine/homoserine/homoserine lactone efflux protein